MQRKSRYFALIALTLLSLCAACATGYQREGVFSNGYSEFRLHEGQYVITYRANEWTPPEKVMHYALKRASQITLENGYQYFTILDQIDTSKGGHTRSHKKPPLHYPSIRLTIECFREKPLGIEVIDPHRFV